MRNPILNLKTFLALLLLVPAGARAEQQMDSLDKLTVSRSSALARARDGYFPSALSAEENALDVMENRYGKTHPALVPILIDLASIHRHMGNYSQAEVKLKWGLALREKALGPEDPLIAETLIHLTSLYDDWGRWTDAEYYGDRALRILDQGPAPDPRTIARLLTRLGSVKLSLKKVPEATALLERNLERPAKEQDPTRKIQTLDLLAKTARAKGDLPRAESFLQKALEISQKNFAHDSIELGDATWALADLYRSVKKVEKARSLFESSHAIYKRYVGVNYAYSAIPYLLRLAKTHQALGDDRSAKDLLEKALVASTESLGPKHPKTALILLELARSEIRIGEDQKAKERVSNSLSILKSYLPKGHPLLLEAETRLKR